MIKIYIIIPISLFVTLSFFSQSSNVLTKKMNAAFQYHFHALDSSANAHKGDTVFYCNPPSIEFMEAHTKIISKTDITFVGKMKFTKTALDKWHLWYQQHQRNK